MTLAFTPLVFKMVLVPIFSHNMLVWPSLVTTDQKTFLEFVKHMRLIMQLIEAKITLKFQFWPLRAFKGVGGSKVDFHFLVIFDRGEC